MRRSARKRSIKSKYPIAHWSHSSLMAYLRNPLAWHKRYVQKVYDNPATPASVIGRAAHTALQHFYSGLSKDGSLALGLEYLRKVPDFEINFGVHTGKLARKAKRKKMEQEYLQAINFYLEKPPRHEVYGVEVSAYARLRGLPIPIKAISDLVVASRGYTEAVDIVDHKFVDSFSKNGGDKTLFIMQALFNYYTVREKFGKEVRRFIVYECRKRKNKDGSPQMRRYVIDYGEQKEHFATFHRLLKDATREIASRKVFLPNPSDMFEGENSFEIYHLGL